MAGRRLALLVLCTAAVLLCSAAQEDGGTCTEEVAAAVKAATAQLKAVTTERDSAASDAKTCKDSYTKLYASWQQQDGEITKLKTAAKGMSAELASLEVRLQEASVPRELDAAGVATAFMHVLKVNTQAALQVAQSIVEDLKQGKTDKLGALAVSTYNTLRGAASSAYAFVKAEAQEHTPEPVKQKISEVVDKVSVLWKQQVLEAEWAQPLLRHLETVNSEVKTLVTKLFSSIPALSPLADPVTIQLVTYAVFALPLLVLLVLPLAVLGGSGKKASDVRSGSQAKSKKKTQKKSHP